MADRTTIIAHHHQSPLMQRLRHHSLNSSQLMNLATLIVSGTILLLLTGITITITILSLIFLTPLIILTSPIWVPIATLSFVIIAGFMSVCVPGLVTVAAVSWLYKYFKGLHPVGSDRVDYARSRIADTASHVKDYAWEYGGYFQRKVKDAAPGA